ncbi:MAG TPA: Ku protein [Anaeromyxobacteraceae bacterium]|nr:Ku protein [Anaeromyxobacteraceae bacterium]
MAPRSIGSGTISFGLVSIPVQIYAATQPKAGVSFNLLHAKDGSRLKQQYVCAKDGERVERDQMVKGYEFEKDRYVVFTPEELKALEEATSPAIEIVEFVPADQVDAVYYDRAYYLAPDKGAAKAYRLLAETLARSGRAALARQAARGKQYLVLLRPAGHRLVMQQLLYADEVRPLEEVPVEEADVKEPEVQLALQLVDQSSSDAFHPELYHDAVRKRLLEAVEKKVAGQEIQLAASAEPAAQVIDLMEALKQSLASPPPGKAAIARSEAESAAEERRPPKRVPREAAAKASRAPSKK